MVNNVKVDTSPNVACSVNVSALGDYTGSHPIESDPIGDPTTMPEYWFSVEYQYNQTKNLPEEFRGLSTHPFQCECGVCRPKMTLGTDPIGCIPKRTDAPILQIPPFDDYGYMVRPHTPGYYDKKVQPIDLINAFNLGFSAGCIVKYACRAGLKDGEDAIKDFKKIIDYANFEIKRIEDVRKCG